MRKTFLFLVLLLISSTTLLSQGYYKDIFMDGGIELTSNRDLPAARRLGLALEYFATGNNTSESPLTLQDTLIQEMLFCGSEIDHNGILLYPDGQPRFKLLYVNGGQATKHGASLTEKGRDNIRQFVKNGGSYVGTCAGMFIASRGTVVDSLAPRPSYLNIWPSIIEETGLKGGIPTGHFIEPNSPLLKYYGFDKKMYIDSIYHNGGGSAYIPKNISTEAEAFPKGTEILLRYDYKPLTESNLSIHNKVSTWAWKENDITGRIVLTGSHPERYTSGERLDLMSSLILYSIEGLGAPQIKGELLNGQERKMDKSTKDNKPAYTKIGDKQYHHFYVNIPLNAKNIKVSLKGSNMYDLNLFMKKGSPAFVSNASIMDISKGSQKNINNQHLESGKWFISVECDTTVDTSKSEWGEVYTGNLSVLNGVPYSILVSWE